MNPKKKNDEYPLLEIKARREHPASSHADCKRQNEKLTKSMKYALHWIKRFPGSTAKELEWHARCPAGKIWKVIAQLERRGLIVRKREGSRPLKIYPKEYFEGI